MTRSNEKVSFLPRRRCLAEWITVIVMQLNLDHHDISGLDAPVNQPRAAENDHVADLRVEHDGLLVPADAGELRTILLGQKAAADSKDNRPARRLPTVAGRSRSHYPSSPRGARAARSQSV